MSDNDHFLPADLSLTTSDKVSVSETYEEQDKLNIIPPLSLTKANP
jgi:hypothetical protein